VDRRGLVKQFRGFVDAFDKRSQRKAIWVRCQSSSEPALAASATATATATAQQANSFPDSGRPLSPTPCVCSRSKFNTGALGEALAGGSMEYSVYIHMDYGGVGGIGVVQS